MAVKIASRRKLGVMLSIIMTVTLTVTQNHLCQAKATLEGHGYKGITIFIQHDIEEDHFLLTKLEESLTNASKVLLRATQGQVYFKEFIIVLPHNWRRNSSYGNADACGDISEKIVISSTKSEYGDAPYVKQPEGCGKPGLFMHLTPSYITDDSVSAKWGPRGKTIAHEWAHLRWGVFDEYATKQGQIKVEGGIKYKPKCPENIKFKENVIQLRKGGYKPKVYRLEGPSQVASIMFTHYLENVMFCNSSEGSAVRHNTKAPNRQNRLCKEKSSWEVMREHSDFKEMRPSLTWSEVTRPQFKYVQTKLPRIVLVLDTSGSMNEHHRLQTMNNAAKTIILTKIKPGTSVGIVEFNTKATVLSELVTITTEADRKTLISRLPTVADGFTSIGAGILLGLEVLHRGMDESSGGTLIVITDGDENTDPRVRDVQHNIYNKSVTPYTISVTESADPVMTNLSLGTGGKSFFDSGDYNSTGLIDSLVTIVTSGDLTHDPRVPVLLQTEAGSVSTSSLLTGEFYVDSTLGHNTTVFISFTSTVNVNLTGPGNISISNHTHPQLYITDGSGIIQILLSDFAKNGTWFYNIIAIEEESHVVVTVQSSASTDGNDVIQVLSWLPEEHNLVFTPDQKLAIYAEVTRGWSSVLNSQVIAVIGRPQSGPLNLILLDNGVGSDITKDDGIYSAYILAKDLSGDGRYGIKVRVEGVEGVTSVVVGGRGGSSGVLEVDTVESIEELVTEELGRFQRVTSGGMFSVSGFPSDRTIPDVLPPSRITDLTVSYDGSGNGTAELEWTSVGGDMDRGTAASYTFYFITDLDLTDSKELNDSVWSEVSQTYLRDLRSPQPAGSREHINIPLDLLGENDILFLCVRATDEEGNKGELSNIVQVTRLQGPDVVPKMEDEEPGSRYYALITTLPILVITFLAVILTSLVLALRRRRRKSFRLERKTETESCVLYSASKLGDAQKQWHYTARL